MIYCTERFKEKFEQEGNYNSVANFLPLCIIITCYVYFVFCFCGDQMTSIYNLAKINVAEADVLVAFQRTNLCSV